MPTIVRVLEQFHGATIFSVLDLNSAYYQTPLSAPSGRITAFVLCSGCLSSTNCPLVLVLVAKV